MFFVERVIENREMAVEAAIVRVMKSRKTLEIAVLIEEVSKLLYQFSATKTVIFSFASKLIFCFFVVANKNENRSAHQ